MVSDHGAPVRLCPLYRCRSQTQARDRTGTGPGRRGAPKGTRRGARGEGEERGASAPEKKRGKRPPQGRRAGGQRADPRRGKRRERAARDRGDNKLETVRTPSIHNNTNSPITSLTLWHPPTAERAPSKRRDVASNENWHR